MKKILVIDTSGILHAAKYSVGKSRLKHNEKETFVVFGFMLKLRSLIKKIRPHATVFTLDSKSSKRRDIYPGYKDRLSKKTDDQKKLDELAYPQFEKVTNHVLPTIGYKNLFRASGFEADDHIANICKKYKKSGIIIATNDEDMYQCLSPTVCIFNINKNEYFTIGMFREKYKIEPEDWKIVKAVGGCASDTVKGIEGVGEGKAIQFIKGTLPKKGKVYPRVVSDEGKAIIEMNKRLVILPFKDTPEFKIKNDRLSKKGLIEVCETYGFNSILHELDNWQSALNIY